MTYVLATKPSFQADLLHLNRDDQKRVTTALEELETDPMTPRGDTVKLLRHHKKLWRYRIGSYRLVYAVYPNRDLVQLLGIGPRGEVYKRFGYQPDEPEYADYSAVLEQALDPNQETPVDWMRYAPQQPMRDTSATLPYRLTPAQLTAWRVPQEHHHFFLGCETEDELQNCGAPEQYIYHIIECMYPASVTDVVDQPNLLVEKPEDLERYARGDLLDFLLLLDDDQKRFVDWGLKGPTLVKGGPGSGKSTVAMYRIRSLVAQPVEKGKKISILFTTYTNALVEFSRQLIDRLMKEYTDRPVQYEVSTLDRIAMKIHGEPRPTMAEARDLSYALASARAVFSPQGKSPLEAMMITNAIKALREDYLLEEFDWVIDGQGLNSLEEYQAVDRTGRGYAFDGRMREAVWSLYDHTCQFLKSMGKTRWGELRRTALERVRSGAYAERYDYIVIDEAQDLTPTALALCVELCKSPQGIFLTADASQSLYNRGFAWKNVHASLKVTGRTRLLKRNYRTTRQIAEAAVSMLNKSEAGDPEALDQYYVHTGPHPTIYAAADESDAFLWLADTLTEAARSLHLPTGAIAVLAPTNNLAKEAARFLSNCGLDTSYFTGKEINLQSPNAKALTIHSCKGLEFPIVAIPYAEVHLLPRDLEDERAEDLEKHLDQERRLLFVGMTRAMRRLYVVHRQGHASPFLDGLAPGLWIQQKFQ